MNPPILLFVATLISIIANTYLPMIKIVPQPFNLIGLFLAVLALLFLLMGFIHFLIKKTTLIYGHTPRALITTGLYGHTRNPLYLSLVIFLTGLAIFMGNLAAFIGLPILILGLDKFLIPREEETLEKIFGDRYRNYKKHVPRWRWRF